MSRVYNFSAGPATLPEEVLKEAASDMLDYHGTGMSVMEMSHRSGNFQKIIDEAEADLRKLLNIPDNYKVLFLQGGGTSQFSMVPLNLFVKGKADYINTGNWASNAIKEAKKYGEVNVIASSEDTHFDRIPKNYKIDKDADYVYICDNNTIYGTKFKEYPETGDIPLVNDASSCFLSGPMDVSKFGLIYAGAQKNIGPAGVVVVIVREDLLKREPKPYTPVLMRYRDMAEKGSMVNTPPTYGIYMCGLVFKWLLRHGGLEAIEKHNIEKAKILYDCLDESKFYIAPVQKDSRSLMNVTFRTPTPELDAEFLAGAEKHNLYTLKGHRKVGGVRASIYNAMTIDGVKALVSYMKEFEKAHTK